MMYVYMLVGAVLLYLVLRELLRLLRIGNHGNRYVFISGCDTGFGNLLAKRLDRFGVNVFAGCLTKTGADQLQKSCSKRLVTVDLNVTNQDSITAAKEFVAKKLPDGKGLWAVVNNAGVAGSVAPIEWQTEDDFRKTLDVNLFGVIFVTKAFLPMVRRERGRVVNMASIMGRFSMSTGPYGASKYGVEGFSDQLRRELYRSGVGVHIIEPGYFRTDIISLDSLTKDLDSRFAAADKEVQRYYGESYRDCRSRSLIKIVKTPCLDKHSVRGGGGISKTSSQYQTDAF